MPNKMPDTFMEYLIQHRIGLFAAVTIVMWEIIAMLYFIGNPALAYCIHEGRVYRIETQAISTFLDGRAPKLENREVLKILQVETE